MSIWCTLSVGPRTPVKDHTAEAKLLAVHPPKTGSLWVMFQHRFRQIQKRDPVFSWIQPPNKSSAQFQTATTHIIQMQSSTQPVQASVPNVPNVECQAK